MRSNEVDDIVFIMRGVILFANYQPSNRCKKLLDSFYYVCPLSYNVVTEELLDFFLRLQATACVFVAYE